MLEQFVDGLTGNINIVNDLKTKRNAIAVAHGN